MQPREPLAESPPAVRVEDEVIPRVLTQLNQTNNEVNQRPDTQRPPATDQKHQDAQANLTAQETVHAERTEEERHQHIKNFVYSHVSILIFVGR